MTEFDSTSTKDFQRKLYQDLDQKLKSTSWNSSVSEAHGLLAGLACRGIGSGEVGNKMYLFQISNAGEIALLEGMFELLLRDLQSSDFTFNILLPDDQATTSQKADEISNWCEGYLQGLYYDGDALINESSESVQEVARDIFDIGGMNHVFIEENDESDEKSLIEIEEYLRVGIQIIYDELASQPDTAASTNSEIH